MLFNRCYSKRTDNLQEEYDALKVAIFSYFLLLFCMFCAFYAVIFLKEDGWVKKTKRMETPPYWKSVLSETKKTTTLCKQLWRHSLDI